MSSEESLDVPVAEGERVQPACVSEVVVFKGVRTVQHTVYYGPSAFVTEEPVFMEEPEASRRLFEMLLADAQKDLPARLPFLAKGFAFLARNASDPDVRTRAAACHADVSARTSAYEEVYQERVSQTELLLASEKKRKSKWYAFWRRWE